MLLAVDVGNTHIVIGLFQGEKLLGNWRLQIDGERTVDVFALEILNLLEYVDCSAEDIKQIIISCVVPALTRVFGKLAQKYFKVQPLIVGPGTKTGIVINCDDPRSVGA